MIGRGVPQVLAASSRLWKVGMKRFCLAIISICACGESNTTTDAPIPVDSPSGVPLFSPQVEYAVGAGAISVAIGDVNGDGQPDLVVANSLDNTVSVLLDTCLP